MSKVAFELKSDVNRVEVNLAETDEPIVITSESSKPLETSDPAVIAALDAAEGVKRVTKAGK